MVSAKFRRVEYKKNCITYIRDNWNVGDRIYWRCKPHRAPMFDVGGIIVKIYYTTFGSKKVKKAYKVFIDTYGYARYFPGRKYTTIAADNPTIR